MRQDPVSSEGNAEQEVKEFDAWIVTIDQISDTTGLNLSTWATFDIDESTPKPPAGFRKIGEDTEIEPGRKRELAGAGINDLELFEDLIPEHWEPSQQKVLAPVPAPEKTQCRRTLSLSAATRCRGVRSERTRASCRSRVQDLYLSRSFPMECKFSNRK